MKLSKCENKEGAKRNYFTIIINVPVPFIQSMYVKTHVTNTITQTVFVSFIINIPQPLHKHHHISDPNRHSVFTRL